MNLMMETLDIFFGFLIFQGHLGHELQLPLLDIFPPEFLLVFGLYVVTQSLLDEVVLFNILNGSFVNLVRELDVLIIELGCLCLFKSIGSGGCLFVLILSMCFAVFRFIVNISLRLLEIILMQVNIFLVILAFVIALKELLVV
jgi:hypothetical protein